MGVCSSIWSLDIFKEVAGKKHSEKTSSTNPLLDCVDLSLSFGEEEIAGVIEEGRVGVVHEKETKILFASTCTNNMYTMLIVQCTLYMCIQMLSGCYPGV